MTGAVLHIKYSVSPAIRQSALTSPSQIPAHGEFPATRRCVVRLDRNEHRNANVEPGAVEQRHAPAQDTLFLQFLNPPPACDGVKTDLLGEHARLLRAIGLQNLKNGHINFSNREKHKLLEFYSN